MTGTTRHLPGVGSGTGIIAHSLYGVLESITGLVGLTPLELVEVIGGFLAGAVILQVARALFDRRGYTLEPTPDQRRQLETLANDHAA